MQQLYQSLETLPPEMAQLTSMRVSYGLIHTGQQLEAFRGNTGHHHAAVLRLPAARDQAAFLQAVEQARNVGVPGNHAASNLAAGKPVRRAAQNP